MKIVARVSQWFDAKNFGFIHENRSGVMYSYFFHRKHLMDGIPAIGKIARFDSAPDPMGRGPIAVNVEIFDSKEEMMRADSITALVGDSTNQAVKS